MLSTPTGPPADPAAPLVGRAPLAPAAKGGMVGLTPGALGVVRSSKRLVQHDAGRTVKASGHGMVVLH